MVTVFTPVYNRAYIIHRLFDSLKEQTDTDFEWVVIDDGSTDNLGELVKEWKKEAVFPIRYQYTKNGGKHRAINLGVKIANSDAFFMVDSDDFLTPDAIEFINTHFKEIANKEDYAGICGLRYSYIHETPIGGEPFFGAGDYVDATTLETDKYGLLGDKAEIYKTQVLKRFPFPEYKNETFLGEGIVLNKIAYEGYKLRWYNKKIYYGDYISDGLSKNIFEIVRQNPIGWAKRIVLERTINHWKDEELFINTFIYFEAMYEKISQKEMCELLEITGQEWDLLQMEWEKNILALKNIFLQKNISTLAIYGMGSHGKRLLTYLKALQKEVVYVIDKNYKEISFKPAYYLDMELPKVDSVCIALRDIPAGLCDKIKSKLPNAYVWPIQDLNARIWQK